MRIGNGAFDQRQNDVYGAVLDSILLHTRRSQRLPRRLWPLVQSQAEGATRVWREPDQGIWEARGAPQHYVSSKLMCWIALDRAAKLAGIRGVPDLQATWGALAEEIRADILEHGVDDRGALRQHYDTDALDASTLLAALFGFLPGDDPRLRASVLAIADELTEDGFVLRYRTGETDDGLSGKEGTFLICSFWLVSALAIIGETARARDLMERLLREASPLGLYAEEFEVATEQSPRELPPGLLAPRADRGRGPDHPRRATGGALMTSYDVIVIGSGAGGGTLVRHLAPSGKRILLLERGDWLRREPAELVGPRRVRRQPLHLRRTPGTTSTASRSSRRSTTTSAARRSSTARRCTGCARRTSASSPPRRRLARLADLLRRARAVLHARRAALPRARRARRGPDRAPSSAPYPHPAVSHEPRIQQLSDDLEAIGRHPFHAPCGVMLNEPTCTTAPACAARPATASRVSCTRSPTPRCSGCVRRSSTTTSRCSPTPRPCGWRPNAAGTRSPASWSTTAACRRRYSADLVVVSCGAANSAKLLLASATEAHPNGLANGSDQVGRNYMFHNSQAVLALSKEPNPTVFQKTLGVNDFYFGDRRLRLPARATSR